LQNKLEQDLLRSGEDGVFHLLDEPSQELGLVQDAHDLSTHFRRQRRPARESLRRSETEPHSGQRVPLYLCLESVEGCLLSLRIADVERTAAVSAESNSYICDQNSTNRSTRHCKQKKYAQRLGSTLQNHFCAISEFFNCSLDNQARIGMIIKKKKKKT
jgi:hypothetical protein